MRHALKPAVLIAPLVVVLTGCATESTWTRTIQPVRTLEEMYAVQDEVNERADRYDFGTGDAVGDHTKRQSAVLAARRR